MREVSVTERLSIQPDTQGSFAWQGDTLVFTPHQSWSAGETVQVELASGSRAAGLLSLPVHQDEKWSFTIRQPRLAYLYPAEGPANLYVMNPLTGESESLTGGAGGVQDFHVNANGTAVYYSVRSGQGGSNIYRLELPTGQSLTSREESTPVAMEANPERILSCPRAQCRVPVVSPDGSYLAYERTALPGGDQPNYPQVSLLPLTAGDLPLSDASPALVLAGDPLHQTLQPAWSPDGLLIFYDTNEAAFIIIDPNDGERARFLNQTGQPGAWHPNGLYYVAPEIFFLGENISDSLSDLEPLANSHLLLFDWQSNLTQDLTPGENMEDTAPAFSPDGDYLAFARKFLDVQRWTPGRQLWLARFGSAEASPLTDAPLYNHFEFAWSPAGDQLAFVRFNQSALTEPPEIWLIDPSTGQANRLIVGGYAPQWLP